MSKATHNITCTFFDHYLPLFKPEKFAIQAARVMLTRIKKLYLERETFAFETTLAAKSHVKLIESAKMLNYNVNLLYFYLNFKDLAIKRVKTRVIEGGSDIPEHVICRRFDSGLKNFFTLYEPIVHNWVFIDNSGGLPSLIAEKSGGNENIFDTVKWETIRKTCS